MKISKSESICNWINVCSIKQLIVKKVNSRITKSNYINCIEFGVNPHLLKIRKFILKGNKNSSSGYFHILVQCEIKIPIRKVYNKF